MKKQITFLLFMFVITVCSACGKQENGKESDLNSVAVNGVGKEDLPQGKTIVYNETDCRAVQLDQSYNQETDSNNTIVTSQGVAGAGNSTYALLDRYLFYLEKNSKNGGLVCYRSDCMHNSTDCPSYIFGTGLTYYKGNLYTVISETNPVLQKISLDGSTREDVLNLLPREFEKTADNSTVSYDWIIHRGYIYYCYQIGNGFTEDSYYLNGSNCIYRKSLDGGEAEAIIPQKLLSAARLCQMKGYGSYVYFNIPGEKKSGGCLYRYNTESDQVECILDVGNDVVSYVISEDVLYYQNEAEPNIIYEYHFDTNERMEFLRGDDMLGAYYPTFYADEEYIYMNHKPNADTFDKVLEIHTWDGEYIGKIELGEDYVIGGMDRERIYLVKILDGTENYFQIICYIEKEELLKGQYHIHEVR